MQHYSDDHLKIKRFGQVFSGRMIGRLLVELLPNDLHIESIIDPMVGQGDLLLAAYDKYPQAEKITGIDIDNDVIEICKKSIPGAGIFNEDAFKSKEINVPYGWDLVITNPPYVRYQTLKSNPEIGLPDGEELRENLVKNIQKSMILDDSERKLYTDVADNYSGLSDMAVPSWILCASIVRQGGYMAMVLPETWLNRDYALPIHYLILRCFDIITIVRDAESVWFGDAQVRTCLFVCKRKKNEPLVKNCASTVFLELTSTIMDTGSLVGKMEYADNFGYNALSQVLYMGKPVFGEGFISRIVPSVELFPGLIMGLSNRKWICEEDRLDIRGAKSLPNEISSLVMRSMDVEYESLGSFGCSIGQGLRTGANDFFYAQVISEKESMILIQTEAWYGQNISVEPRNIRKTLKKKTDVDGVIVEYDDLNKCILYVQDQVREEDYEKLSQKVIGKYTIIGSGLSDYISEGEKYISPSHKKHFRELSAVITNEKKTDDGFERFWYMLPELKDRHRPNLCMSRVCGGSPEILFVNQQPGKEIVVDANFITLWNSDYSSCLQALALLNSTWAKAFLEVSGTTMGGGALKIEASHLRKMVFPKLSLDKEKLLESIGRRILKDKGMDERIQDQIDEIVLSPFGTGRIMIKKHLEDLLGKKLLERTGRRNDG